MTNELQDIQAKITAIMDELKSVYIVPVNQDKLSSIRRNIIELLELTTLYLNEAYNPMTSWQKEHIVGTVNALYWDWLHLAINSIRLAIADPNTISPSNSYKNEIIELTFDDLTKQISILKKFLT